jgi:hypothetical protein
MLETDVGDMLAAADDCMHIDVRPSAGFPA